MIRAVQTHKTNTVQCTYRNPDNELIQLKVFSHPFNTELRQCVLAYFTQHTSQSIRQAPACIQSNTQTQAHT